MARMRTGFRGSCGRVARAPRPRLRRTIIRAGRCGSSCRSRPAASTTSPPASSRTILASGSASSSSSTIAAAPVASLPTRWSPMRRPTATPSSSSRSPMRRSPRSTSCPTIRTSRSIRWRCSSPARIARTVNPGLPVNGIKEFIALAKSKARRINMPRPASPARCISRELFKIIAVIDILHVPFRGAGPAGIDVVAGNTKATFTRDLGIGHIRNGKLRALGVGNLSGSPRCRTCRRSSRPALPDYEAANWIGFAVPAGTPKAVVQRLHKEIVAGSWTCRTCRSRSTPAAPPSTR